MGSLVMRSFLPLALLVFLLLSPSSSYAQPRQTGAATASNPAQSVRSWYIRFLSREPDRVGMRTWTNALRDGDDSRDVLAQILGGGEYYWRAGSTEQGFVETLWLDLTGVEPDAQLSQDLRRIVQRDGREHGARIILEKAETSGSEQDNGEVAEWRRQVESEAEQLTLALEQLEEDVVIELTGNEERKVYGEIENYLAQLDRFVAKVRSPANRDRLQEEFRDIDERLHELASNLQRLIGEHRSLSVHTRQVMRADRRMHAVVYQGTTRNEDQQRQLLRQAELFGEELKDLRRTAKYALRNAESSQALDVHLDELCAAAEHLVQSAQADADLGHLRADLAPISQGWELTVDLLNNMPPRSHLFLRRQAQRADTAMDRLEEMLNVEGDRHRVYVR